MSRLGNLNGKALRVALCAAEMTGAAAEPIGDVQAIVDSRYDEVAYGGYTRAMMRDELEEEVAGQSHAWTEAGERRLCSRLWGRCFPGHTHNAADAANAAIAKARSGEQGGRHSAQAGTLGQERLHTTSSVDHTTPQAFLGSFAAMYAAPSATRVTPLEVFRSLRNKLDSD